MRLSITLFALLVTAGAATAQSCETQELHDHYISRFGLPAGLCDPERFPCERAFRRRNAYDSLPPPQTFQEPMALDRFVDSSGREAVLGYRPTSEAAFAASAAVRLNRLADSIRYAMGVESLYDLGTSPHIRATSFASGTSGLTDLAGYCRHHAIGQTFGPTETCVVVSFKKGSDRYALMVVGTEQPRDFEVREPPPWTGRSKGAIIDAIVASPFSDPDVAIEINPSAASANEFGEPVRAIAPGKRDQGDGIQRRSALELIGSRSSWAHSGWVIGSATVEICRNIGGESIWRGPDAKEQAKIDRALDVLVRRITRITCRDTTGRGRIRQEIVRGRKVAGNYHCG